MSAASCSDRHADPERSRTSGARLADGDDRRPARSPAARSRSAKVAALEAAAENDDDALAEALDGAPRRLDVGGLRVVDEPHAADLGHRLERVLEAGESFDRARSSPPASTPASDATAAAASTSASRCRPSSRIADSGTSGSSPLAVRRDDRVAVERRCRRASAGHREAAAAVRARRRAIASDAGSSAFSTAQSVGCWFAKMRAFAAAYSSTVAWRSR